MSASKQVKRRKGTVLVDGCVYVGVESEYGCLARKNWTIGFHRGPKCSVNLCIK